MKLTNATHERNIRLLIGPRSHGPGSHFYLALEMRRKQNRETARVLGRPDLFSEPAGPTARDPAIGYLLHSELAAVMELAALSPRERRVASGLLQGATFREMAQVEKVSHTVIGRVAASVRRKMTLAAERYPYGGLWEIYADETHRR